MAYDEDLAERMRELLLGDADVTEKKMFGGLAFLAAGHMAIVASGEGGALVRIDPDDESVARTKATPAIMRGRQMTGWVRVASDDLRTKRQLAPWVERSTTYARSLPPKRR